mmetsp:Transcript_8989/g.10793  ORF Transcript_8989/g.10793 Transcript_8989/m.10793 type:complete len:320 (-) Transcript_8989:187-1146(-)
MHYFSGSIGNLLDLSNITVGLCLSYEWIRLVLHLKEINHLLVHLHRPAGDVVHSGEGYEDWLDYHHELVEIEHAVEEGITDMKMIRVFAVIVVFSMIFELFKVWEGIPALRGVAQTISIAGNGLMSFSLVLGCLITLFGGAGMLAFGQQMIEFHDMISAIISTLTIMTTGDSAIYERQFELNPFIATVWYWTLVCIMYLVCLNLVLCILVDAYGEANAALSNDNEHIPTLYEQGRDTLMYFLNYNQLKQHVMNIKDGFKNNNSNNDGNHNNSKVKPIQKVGYSINSNSTSGGNSARSDSDNSSNNGWVNNKYKNGEMAL